MYNYFLKIKNKKVHYSDFNYFIFNKSKKKI